MRKIKPYTYGMHRERRPVYRRDAPDGAEKFFSALRITAAVICGLFALTFIFTMLSGIVNPGNIAGLIFCLSVILLVLLYPLLKQYDTARGIARALGVILTLCAVYACAVSGFIISGLANTPDIAVSTSADSISADSTSADSTSSPSHTVIVLGCKTINGEPSVMLKTRLDKAVEYEKEHPDCVIIISGGKGDDEIEPEAVTMRRYLAESGIDQDKLYVEAKSQNTADNIEYSKQIIERRQLPKTVVIISEVYHVYRAVRLAKEKGLDAYAEYALTGGIYIFTLPSYWAREIIAVSRDYVRTYLNL